jgi:hypothetical protein
MQCDCAARCSMRCKRYKLSVQNIMAIIESEALTALSVSYCKGRYVADKLKKFAFRTENI